MIKFASVLVTVFLVVPLHATAQGLTQTTEQEATSRASNISPKVSPSRYPWLNASEDKILAPIVRAIRYSPDSALSDRAKEIRTLINTDRRLVYDALSLAEQGARENDREATAFFCIMVDAAMAFNRQGNPQQFNYMAEQNCLNTLGQLADQASPSAMFWRAQYWASGRQAGTRDRYARAITAAADQKHAWAAYLAGFGYIHGNTGFGKDEAKGRQYLEFARSAFTRPSDIEIIDRAYASAKKHESDVSERAEREKANFEAAVSSQRSLEVMYACSDSANMGHGYAMAKTLGGLLANDAIAQLGGFMQSLPRNVSCRMQKMPFDVARLSQQDTTIYNRGSGTIFVHQINMGLAVVLLGSSR